MVGAVWFCTTEPEGAKKFERKNPKSDTHSYFNMAQSIPGVKCDQASKMFLSFSQSLPPVSDTNKEQAVDWNSDRQ